MNVLHVVGGLPSPERPFFQPFTKAQIDSLVNEGIVNEIVNIEGYESPLNYFKFVTKIKKIVKEKHIDIIHAHYGYCGMTALLAFTNVPIVLSLLGSDLLGGIPNSKRKTSPKDRLERIITLNVAKRVDKIIVKSKQMKENLHVKIPIEVVPNGIDFDVFKPTEIADSRKTLNISKDSFIVLFLGNPKSDLKNIQLAKNGYNCFIKKYNINDSLFLNPFGISQTDVVNYLNASDVVLLTSYWEGSPNVIKEAMACNLPIISVNVGDVNEVIYNTKNCFIVPYDEIDIADKLNAIYLNKQRSNGREKISKLRKDLVAKKILEIYKSVLNNI